MMASRAIRFVAIACAGLACVAMVKPPDKSPCRDSTNLAVWRMAHDHKSRRAIVQYLWDQNIEFTAARDDDLVFKLPKDDYSKLAQVSGIVMSGDIHNADYWSQGFLITASEILHVKFDPPGSVISAECRMAYTGP